MNPALKLAYTEKVSEILDKSNIKDVRIQIDYHYDEVPVIRYDVTEYMREDGSDVKS